MVSPTKASSPPTLRNRAGVSSNQEASSVDILKTLRTINTSLNSLDKRISALQKKVDNLDVKFSDILSKIDQLESNMDQKLGKVASDLAVQEENCIKTSIAFEKRLDCVERCQNSCDLLISGIPVIKDENLNECFHKIATIINFTFSEKIIDSIYRIPSKHSKVSPAISVKFLNKSNRDRFFVQYLKFKNLNLKQLEYFESTSRIYINEKLTKRNYSIYREVQQLHRKGIVAQVFTRNGLVHIRKPNDDTIIAVTDLEELNSILGHHT